MASLNSTKLITIKWINTNIDTVITMEDIRNAHFFALGGVGFAGINYPTII